MAVVALTDIHGRFDLLDKMVLELKKKLTGSDHTLVLCGDYMDRGPQSLGVLEALMRGTDYFTFASEIIYLKGNHEELFLNAINKGSWRFLMDNGGVATMTSLLTCTATQLDEMGVPYIHDHPTVQKIVKFFEEKLQLCHIEGKYFFVHAGVNPHRSIMEQLQRIDEEDVQSTFLWVRELFLKSSSDLGFTVVHGHTPHFYDHWRSGSPHRINLDSGACYGGTLTGLIIHDTHDRSNYEIVTVQGEPKNEREI